MGSSPIAYRPSVDTPISYTVYVSSISNSLPEPTPDSPSCPFPNDGEVSPLSTPFSPQPSSPESPLESPYNNRSITTSAIGSPTPSCVLPLHIIDLGFSVYYQTHGSPQPNQPLCLRCSRTRGAFEPVSEETDGPLRLWREQSAEQLLLRFRLILLDWWQRKRHAW